MFLVFFLMKENKLLEVFIITFQAEYIKKKTYILETSLQSRKKYLLYSNHEFSNTHRWSILYINKDIDNLVI